MKKLFVFLMVVFVSLNFVACAEKKDNKTRLTQGAGRQSAVAGTALASGWSQLNAYSWEDELQTSNPDAAARAFINNDSAFMGPSYVNSVQMRLVFNQNQINASRSSMGFKFYDSQDPLTYYVGPETGATVTGYRNGNTVSVIFNDGGTIEVVGTISGAYISGYIRHDGGATLGNFRNFPISKVIFN